MYLIAVESKIKPNTWQMFYIKSLGGKGGNKPFELLEDF